MVVVKENSVMVVKWLVVTVLVVVRARCTVTVKIKSVVVVQKVKCVFTVKVVCEMAVKVYGDGLSVAMMKVCDDGESVW